MSDEDSQQEASDDEPIDVKAKLAQMSGSRIRQQREQRRVAAKVPAQNQAQNQPQTPPAKPTYEVEYSPEVLAAPGPTPPEPASAPKTPAAKPATAPAKAASERRSVGPVPTFLAGLVAGCAPGIVSLVIGLNTNARPAGVPADAVMGAHAWIRCDEGGKERWQCEVFGGDGKVASSGEFVAAADRAADPEMKGDWRALATHDSLVADGWYSTRAVHSKSLYVRGVKVLSAREAK